LAQNPGSKAKSDAPHRLHIGVLPDSLSRYNSPTRADSIRHVVSQANFDKGKVVVLLVLDDAEHLLAGLNAISRALPRFSAKEKPSKVRLYAGAVTADGTFLDVPDTVAATVEAARDSAELVDSPPSDMNPDGLATRARALLKDLEGVQVTEIKGTKLLDAGLGGIHAVGRAATAPPRMIVAKYAGTGGKTHVALVGKGVTFDTGGLHLKPRGAIETMKCDMGGSAAVLGAFRSLVAAGCDNPVTLILCIAENSIDAASYKPDDILKMHSGKTVEINNTDAEGRLLLADGLSYAARELAADVLIDAATLTGAQMISTGQVHAAIMTNDEELETAAVVSGRRSGDLVHPLLFAPELLQHEFASKVADMRNSVANRANAQSSCAGQFLYSHIADAPGSAKRRWCHIDLAGPAFYKGRGTGYGVALISDLVQSL
jgi:probable aminopeptidase NPEPL1